MEKNKMLIDATHPEETRVVAMRNGRVEEFDFESAARKLLRGNIYLAKVTRVEPSLQAAFIDYGGNRHGFLAFNEIHPDYYQIPVADREALKQEEAEAELRAEAEIDERARSRGPRRRRKGRNERSGPVGATPSRDGGDDFAPRDAESSEIETFEDGYSTSSGYDRGGDDRLPEDERGPRDAPMALRHDGEHHDILRAAPESRQPTADRDIAERVHHDERTPGSLDDVPPSVGREATLDATGNSDIQSSGAAGYADPHPDASQGADWRQEESRPRELPGDESSEDDADNGGNGSSEEEAIEQVSSDEDVMEEVPERPRRRARQYKIQEVIKRRQVMLVQVVKEERGNKGAALTTYISLAGRYTVLMPNTARGGGISRKITQPQDRKRLKAIADELDVPEGMGLIIRTAGAARTKQEIKRDYEYLLRLWESVRDLTLSSTAPAVVYEEGNIIKRAIRDLYSKEFDQIVVAGDAAHREAQDFMEMLMPGSGGHVASYRGAEPLFARYGIERQLNALFSPHVTLRSGGYIVINQTEALVAVDVNSGKSTREYSIEETALNTNLEAAEEIARQLKLRDLAGLVVVDFIDMEEKRNNRSVERKLKDSLRHDRARIQVGHISHFGLLEMSRQRLRAGVLEGSTSQCPHCQGTGIVRSIESVALGVLRGIEDYLIKQASSVSVSTTAEVALYILNHKRAFITDVERRYGIVVRVEASDRMQGANFAVERIAAPVASTKPAVRAAVSMEWGFDRDADAERADEPEELAVSQAAAYDDRADEFVDDDRRGVQAEPGAEESRGRKRRRRRGRRDRDGEARQTFNGAAGPAGQQPNDPDAPDAPDAPGPALHTERGQLEQMTSETGDAALSDEVDDEIDAEAEPQAADGDRIERAHGEGGDQPRRGRRRGRRGGRSRRRETAEGLAPGIAGGLDDPDRNEWGVAEVARAGAAQPADAAAMANAVQAVGLVGSVEPADYGRSVEPVARPGIVETSDAAGDRRPRFDAAKEAVRLAVRLASPMLEPASAEPKPEDTSSGWPPPRPPVAAPVTPRPRIVAEAPANIPAPRPAPEITFREPVVVEQLVGEPVIAAPSSAASGNGRIVAGEQATVEQGTASGSAAPGSEAAAVAAATEDLARPSRRGWWQRRFGGGE